MRVDGSDTSSRALNAAIFLSKELDSHDYIFYGICAVIAKMTNFYSLALHMLSVL